MRSSSDHRSYRPIDCILVSCLFLFIADSIYLLYNYSGARIWLEDSSEFFFFVQFQYATTLIEGIIFGVCLLPLFFVSKRFLSPQSANAVVNIGLIALTIVLIRKVLIVTYVIGPLRQIHPAFPIAVLAKWALIAGVAIILLAFIFKKLKKILIEVLSTNIISGKAGPLIYLSFATLLIFSSVFFYQISKSLRVDAGKAMKTSVDSKVRPSKDLPNILFIVYDAFAARHTSFENYPRNTTPNLKNFAEGANYYQNHFSVGVATRSSSATLMTGKDIPHHRVFFSKMLLPEKQIEENIFKITKELGYKNIFYSHTSIVEAIALQMREWIDYIKPGWELMAYSNYFIEIFSLTNFFTEHFQVHDLERQWVARWRPSSTFLDPITKRLSKSRAPFQKELIAPYEGQIEIVHSWLYEQIKTLQSPSFFYFHLNPPRPPLHYRKIFQNKFSSIPVSLPIHPKRHLGKDHRKYWSDSVGEKDITPLNYDRNIFDTDDKFGDLISELKRLGFYDDALIIVTSDHGMTFQEDALGVGIVPYNERIKVPLIIKFPGQKKGQIHNTLTSSLDISSSLVSLLGADIPDWMDGKILPGFPDYTKQPEPRAIFSTTTFKNVSWEKLKTPVVSLIKYPYKLIYYYHSGEFELYNIQEDEEETKDINEQFPEISGGMAKEIVEFIEKYDSKYTKRD